MGIAAHHPLFEEALREVDGGEVSHLRELLDRSPDLARARCASTEPPYDGYFFGATLLHHVAGNPTRTAMPDTIVEVARALLEAGADPDATCGRGPSQPEAAYTTLGLLASSARAHVSGHTEGLIEVLIEHGAAPTAADLWAGLYHVVEHRGLCEAIRWLHDRGAPADLPFAAGLGRLDIVEAFFDAEGALQQAADELWREAVRDGERSTPEDVLADTLLAASVGGALDVAAWLLDRGAPLDRMRGWGPFVITPLHGAAWAGWPEVIELLLDGGATTTMVDPTFEATPRGWAEHCGRTEAIEAFERAGVSR